MLEVKKNEEYVVDIIDNGINGEGIAKINNFTVFVPQTLIGEKVKILIVKVQSSYAFGKVLEFMNKSEHRMKEDCNTYKRCGGCNLRFIDYSETLKIKQNIVKNCFIKSLGENVDVKTTIGMEIPKFYRNKLQYPVGVDKNGKAVMGVYANRTHEIIPTKHCLIQNEKNQEIANDAFNFLIENGVKPYNEKKQIGDLRHIVIRIGISTNEVMLILVLNSCKLECEKSFVEYICEKHPEIKTIVKNINSKNTNVILGMENNVIYGEGYIFDHLEGYKFKISPLSFYQVNHIQTEKLYNVAVDYAELKGNETILDLYCGIGTIGIFASKFAKKLYGIEIIENAIKDAKENAKINNIDNAEFYCGDVEKLLPKIMKKEKIAPNVVFIDPPRKGCDTVTIENLLKLKPEKIVYISCNPATLARDVALLKESYKIKKVQPVDMFPYTRTRGSCISIEFKIKMREV